MPIRYFWPAVALLGVANADFSNFYYSANASCPGLQFECEPPLGVCTYAVVTGKYYCCSGVHYPVCWTGSTQCGGSKGSPSSVQISCQVVDNDWCCLDNSEQCTQVPGQSNICHSRETNPLADVSNALLNQTYSSLSSADPSATAWTIDASSMVAEAASTSTSSSTSSTSSTSLITTTSSLSSTSTSSSLSSLSTSSSLSSLSTSLTSTSPPSSASTPSTLPTSTFGLSQPTPTPSPPNTISGGAVAGIVVGAIIAVLLLASAAYFLGLRHKRAAAAGSAVASPWSFSGGGGSSSSSSSGGGGGGGGNGNPQPSEKEPTLITANTSTSPSSYYYQQSSSASPHGPLQYGLTELHISKHAQELGDAVSARELPVEPAELLGSGMSAKSVRR